MNVYFVYILDQFDRARASAHVQADTFVESLSKLELHHDRKPEEIVFSRLGREFMTIPQNCQHALSMRLSGLTQIPSPRP